MNGMKTVLLLGVLSGLLLVGGEAAAGRQGLYIGLFIAIAMNAASYFFSDKIALRMYSAKPVTETENSLVHRRVAPMVHNLCMQMGLPMPKLWLIPEASPNAFATGRNPAHGSVAFTAGLLELMDDRELEGVIAHELGHIRNRDILIASVAATIAAAITMVARMAWFAGMFGGRRDDQEEGGGAMGLLFMMIVAPIAALLIHPKEKTAGQSNTKEKRPTAWIAGKSFGARALRVAAAVALIAFAGLDQAKYYLGLDDGKHRGGARCGRPA